MALQSAPGVTTTDSLALRETTQPLSNASVAAPLEVVTMRLPTTSGAPVTALTSLSPAPIVTRPCTPESLPTAAGACAQAETAAEAAMSNTAVLFMIMEQSLERCKAFYILWPRRCKRYI